MKTITALIGLAGLMGLSNSYAANDMYIAKSSDSCYMIAKQQTLKQADGTAIPGMMFKGTTLSNHRVDAHCTDFVLKLRSNVEVFVPHFTVSDLDECRFDDHLEKAGADKEKHILHSKKFILITDLHHE